MITYHSHSDVTICDYSNHTHDYMSYSLHLCSYSPGADDWIGEFVKKQEIKEKTSELKVALVITNL